MNQQLFINGFSTTLAAALSASATQMTLAAGQGQILRNAGVGVDGDYLRVELTQAGAETSFERVYITSVTGDVAKILRNRDGNKAVAWASGDKVRNYGRVSQHPPIVATVKTPETYTLEEGLSLTVNGDSTATGSVTVYAQNFFDIDTVYAISANTSRQIGAFSGNRKVVFAPTAGSIDATVGFQPPTQGGISLNPTGTNDHVAINSLLLSLSLLAGANGGVLTLGAGTFDIGSSIVMQSNVRIVGQGEGVTILRLKNNVPYSNNSNVIYAAASGADLSNFGVSNLTLDGNRDNQQRIQTLLSVTSAVRVGTLVTVTVPSTAILDTNGFVYLTGATGGNASVFSGSKGITVTGPTTFTYTAASSGNDSATGTLKAGTTDNGYNGIVLRGSADGAYLATNWRLSNLELKNCGYHGGAAYDSCTNFEITGIHAHHNGFRAFHVHAEPTVSTSNAVISKIRLHDNCIDTTTGLQGGDNGGLFVFYANLANLVVSDIVAFDEKGPAIDIQGTNAGTLSITSITQTGGIATATTSVAHGMAVSTKATIVGTNTAGYGGRITVLSTPTATTFTYAVPASSAASAVGTMTAIVGSAYGAVFNNISINNCGAGIFIGAGVGDVSINGFTIRNCNTTNKAAIAFGYGIHFKSGGTMGAYNINISNGTIADCSSWGVFSDSASLKWNNCSFSNVQVHENGSNIASQTGGIKLASFDQFSLVNVQSASNNAGSSAPRQLYLVGSTNGRVQALCDAGSANFPAVDVDSTSNGIVFAGGYYNRNTSANVGNIAGTKITWARGQVASGKTLNVTGATNVIDLFGGVASTPIVATAYVGLDTDDTLFWDCTAGNSAYTLPTASTVPGKEITVKKIDAGVNTLSIAGIDGGTTILAAQNQGVRVKSNGVVWYKVGAFA